MSLQTDLLLKAIKPADIVKSAGPAILNELKSLGAHDEDGDGQVDFEEVKAAIVEMEEGAVKFEHGAAKVVHLVEAYKAKFIKK